MFYRHKIAVAIASGILFSGGVCITAYGQEEPLQALQASFINYQKERLQEKIYVHTDKSFYLAGELVWFKAYCVHAGDNRPMDLSKVAHVELLDGNNRPVMQAKIALKQGSGNGSFLLPGSVGSGTYRLRAYTAWMKNFGADYYFAKDLTVINTLRSGAMPESSASVQASARFFPEGGNLVAGLPGRVGFRVADQMDKGQDCTGFVVDDRNDTAARFSSLKFGIGRFEFTPHPGRQYKALVKTADGANIVAPLPAPVEKGYVLRVESVAADKLAITVQANIEDAAARPLYLLVHTRQQLKLATQTNLQNGKAGFLVDKSALGEGISQITVFDNMRRPVCERLYFKPPEQRLSIIANADAAQYGVRQKVDVYVVPQLSGKPASADLSVAVFRVDSLILPDGADIFNYLWLASDLKGRVESPGYYFKKADAETQLAADNLMLTHGWRRFQWSDVLNNQPPAFRFLPEYQGHLVAAKVTDARTGSPAIGVPAYVSIPGTQLQYYATKSDSLGNALFPAKSFYGPNEMIAQAYTSKDSRYKIEVVNPFSNQYAPPPVQHIPFTPAWQPSLVRYSVQTQVQNSFAAKELERFALPEIDSMPFYGAASKQYLLDDFKRFTTMEEVLREYVVEVGVRKRGNQFSLPVMQELTTGFASGEPLVLLDGVPVFDNNQVMSYDPLKVRKIEVVAGRYFHGPLAYDGIINLTTYNGTLDGYSLDTGAVVVDYEGLQLQREYYVPDYSDAVKAESRVPDFRSLLYWNPGLPAAPDGKSRFTFYTSDVKGTYIAVVEGLTANGDCGSGYFVFTVQ